MELIQDYINYGKEEEFDFYCERGCRMGETIRATVRPRSQKVYFTAGFKNGVSPAKPYPTCRILKLKYTIGGNKVVCEFRFDFCVWRADIPWGLAEKEVK